MPFGLEGAITLHPPISPVASGPAHVVPCSRGTVFLDHGVQAIAHEEIVVGEEVDGALGSRGEGIGGVGGVGEVVEDYGRVGFGGGRGSWSLRPVEGPVPLMAGKAAALLKMVRVKEVEFTAVGRTWCCQDWSDVTQMGAEIH